MQMQDKVYRFIAKHASGEKINSSQVAEAFSIRRSVASHYLNRLVEEGRLIKTNTRPVLFFIPQCDEKDGVDTFSSFIGANGTIKKQIEKCKAAVNYPPYGLPLIIRGNSGTGKSYLASQIHQYAIEEGVISENAPFVVLNCADYANNSELLSSVLFGYEKGSFTGANQTKNGLLAAADGGYLFLDEIHNLSAENQEKLFLLMDEQKYRRLGQNEGWQYAQIRLILATTESTQESLLTTFRRRIPVEITLPDYKNRSLTERQKLVFSFFQQESSRIYRELTVSKDILKQLINDDLDGNIGELRNKIQVYCAQSYTQYKNEKTLFIGNSLSDEVISFVPNHKKINHFVTPVFVSLERFKNKEFIKSVDLIKDYLHEQSIEIKKIEAEFEYIQDLPEWCFTKKLLREEIRNALKKFGLKINDFSEEELILLILSIYNNETNISMSISLESQKRYEKFFMLARLIIEPIFHEQNTTAKLMKELTAVYLFNELSEKDTIPAFIIMHGEQSAKNIASISNQLMGSFVYEYFDMPIDISSDGLIARIQAQLSKIDTSRGLVLLVDMGSLEKMYEKLQHHVTGDLVIINNVSTAMAIDIGFKLKQQTSISELTNIDLKRFSPHIQYYEGISPKRNIIVSCISGKGISNKVKEIFQEYLQEEIEIVTIDFYELREILQKNNQKLFRNSVALFTTSEMKSTEFPIVNIESLVNGDSDLTILNGVMNEENQKKCINEIIKLFTFEGASTKLKFLNPEIILNEVEKIINGYEMYYSIEFQHFIRMNLFLHFSTLVERILVGDYSDGETTSFQGSQKKAFTEFLLLSEKLTKEIRFTYNIEIPKDEYALIFQIIEQLKNIG